MVVLLLLLLRPSVLKGYIDFLGAAEYLVYRETKLRESCRLRTGRRGDAVQTWLWTHKDLYKTCGAGRRTGAGVGVI